MSVKLWFSRFLLGPIVIIIVLVSSVWTFLPRYIEADINRIDTVVIPEEHRFVSNKTRILHASITIADWHADSLLWDRNLLDHDSIGHLDFPRLQTGGVALQMFTAVTKSPKNLNEHRNTDETDRITALAMIQRWPPKTWDNLLERALYQGRRLERMIAESQGAVRLITNRSELQQLLWDRQQEPMLVGALLGVEGGHALNRNLSNLDHLYAAGFRMMGLHHFFDNALGGSLHGESKQGLTIFGREVVQRMNYRHMIIDLAHSSVAVIEDVLAVSTLPVVISHTGINSHCPSSRNYPDPIMKKIADAGGLIAIGFWQEVVCDHSPAGIALAIKAAVNLVGIDHVSLGSDFDGGVTTTFDASEMAMLTQALSDLNFNESDIAQVMGGNMVRFLAEYLPE